METQSSIATQLQRVVNVCTLEATEYERSQRLGLLQPALDALAQSAYQQQQQQQAGLVPSATPQGRANVLHRPLAAATHATEQDAAGTPAVQADAAAGAGAGASKAGAQPTPATAGMLPTPLLMTPAGAALLQTPATGWGVSGAGAGMRPVAGFPHHFLHGMMGGTTLMHQNARPMQQHIEADDGKLSKKRQGYHIEPAALQKLIEKQQLEAQRKQEQELQAVAAASARVSQAAAEAEAAAAAAAATAAAAAAAAVSAPLPASGSNPPDEPPPRQPQQQHRPRVMSRLPPQVQEQAERQAAERARKAAEQKEQEEADAAAAAAAADGTGSSRVAHSVRAVGGGGVFAQGGGGRQQAAPMTAADCLESPNNGSLGGLRLPVGPELDPQGPEGMGMGLDNSKLFGSAQKRLRLSLCDEHGSLMPGGQPLISPVVLPTPSPAVHAATPAPVPGLAGRGGAGAGAGPAGGGGGGGSSAAAGAAAGGDGGQQAGAAAVGTCQEAPTPSKFFTGSPVPQTERRALGHAEPETPMALLTGQAPAARTADVQEALMDPLRGGAQAKAEGAAAGHTEGGAAGGSGWVPVPGQAPAVLGATPAPPAPPAAGGGEGDDMELDPAAAAAMPLPESPVKQVTAVGAAQAGVSGGGESGGMVLQTPEGQEQTVAATPVTGM